MQRPVHTAKVIPLAGTPCAAVAQALAPERPQASRTSKTKSAPTRVSAGKKTAAVATKRTAGVKATAGKQQRTAAVKSTANKQTAAVKPRAGKQPKKTKPSFNLPFTLMGQARA